MFLIFVVGLVSCNQQSKSKNEESENDVFRQSSSSKKIENSLDSLCLYSQFYGNCYAYSSPKSKMKSNGEAISDNLPKKIDKRFKRKGFYLVLNPSDTSVINGNILACKLYLVNRTDTLITLNAVDSRLNIIAEALNDKFEWQPISCLPSSDCGNSYHRVALEKDEYWSFDIPFFKGFYKSKIRYSLYVGSKYVNKVISNEIDAYINKEQFIKVIRVC